MINYNDYMNNNNNCLIYNLPFLYSYFKRLSTTFSKPLLILQELYDHISETFTPTSNILKTHYNTFNTPSAVGKEQV